MVDLAEIQAAYYMVAATGVIIAAIYYVYNMRISQRNSTLALKAQEQNLETRKLQLITALTQQLFSKEAFMKYGELLNMEWRDYDDFEKKYGSDFNLENYANRSSTNYTYNSIGFLLREGLVDSEVLYGFLGVSPSFLWYKFEDVIVESRRRYSGKDNYEDLEFLAKEMLRIKMMRDPEYKLPETFNKYIPTK